MFPNILNKLHKINYLVTDKLYNYLGLSFSFEYTKLTHYNTLIVSFNLDS